MHELSVAEAIVESLNKKLGERRFAALRKIFLRIGSLSCVQDEALRFAFSVLQESGRVPKISLEIERVEAKLKCNACKAEFKPEDNFIRLCPHCGSFDTQLICGEELNIVAVEVGD